MPEENRNNCACGNNGGLFGGLFGGIGRADCEHV